MAFEFPSFQTYSTPPQELDIPDGRYTLALPGFFSQYLALKDEDATDGAPVVASNPGSDQLPQKVSIFDPLNVEQVSDVWV